MPGGSQSQLGGVTFDVNQPEYTQQHPRGLGRENVDYIAEASSAPNDPAPWASCFSLLTEGSALRRKQHLVTDKSQATIVTKVDCTADEQTSDIRDQRLKAGQSLINPCNVAPVFRDHN